MNQEGGPGDEGGSGRGQGPRRVHQGVWDRQGVGSPRTALGCLPAVLRFARGSSCMEGWWASLGVSKALDRQGGPLRRG